MYNFDPDTPTAVSSSDDEGVRAALNWAIAKYNEDDSAQAITVWTHQQSNKSNNSIVEKFIDSHRDVNHVTGRGVRGRVEKGPLVIVWGDPEDIAAAVGHSWAQISSIVVIECVTENIYPWVKYSDAELLGDPSIWEEQTAEIDPVVVRGLEGMTRIINHNNTISGVGFEKDHTVGPLVLLHDAGYAMDSKAIKGWAAAHGWRGDNVKHLGDYVNQINRGGRPRFSAGSTRTDYVKFLEREVEESANEPS